MNVPKGKPSTSPPVQISQQPNRNIVPAPPRGQTPPIRQDFTVDPQSGYSYQTGFAVSAAAHPHEMSKQTVTSGGLPQPGLTPQTSIYSTNPRPFYPGQQQQMRQPRPQFMNNMPGQAPMYQQMVYVSPSNAYPNQAGQIMYQPQNVMYGQRMPQQYATIPNNVQQPFQQYPANQAYASGTQQSYPLYYQQQPQQQTPAIPVGPIAQSRPASVPNQTAPPKRERNPITIVDPTTKKDVTDEILHHKSTPPSSTGTPVSFPISTSPPQQQNEICAQFASQVAATLRSQPSKHSSNSSDGMASPHVSDSTQGSTTPEPNPIQHSNEMQQNQQHSINMASGDVIKGETSVDPPSFIPDSSVKSNQHQKDPVVFEANEYNVNVSNMQKEATASKAAVVSANLDNLPEKEVPPSKSEPVSIPSQPQKNNIDIKLGSISAQNTTESKPKSSNEVTESVPKSQKIPVTVSVKNSSPPPAFTKDIKKPKSEGSVEKAEVAPTKSKTSVPTPGPQMAVDKKEESVKSTPQEPKLQSPKLQSPVAAEKEVEEIKQTVKEEVKESGPSTTEQEKEPRDNTSPLDNKTIPELTPPTKTEANESVIKEEPVAPPVSVSTDNKNETIPQVEIKIEDVDVSKENAKNNEMTSEALNNSQVPKTTEMQLQYKYKPEQWSPVNPEGKMMYDREFLLQLQFADNSVSKPQGLPNLPDIILDRPVNQSKINDMGSVVRDFTPDFFQTLPGSRSGSSQMIRKKNSQQGPRNEPGKKIIKTISISSQDIKLHKAEKAWKPEKKQEKSDMSGDELEETKTKEIYKQVKSILNKLTPQKFQTLLRQVTELDINTESRLIGVTDLIFEKAVSEPAFSVAYANLCRYLSQLKVPSDSKPGEMVNFRTILLTNCQKEFMKDNDVESDLEERRKKIEEAKEEEKKKLEDEYKVAETSARRRSIGNIRFIGELFKLKMLTVNIMHNCVFKLLKSRDAENLECLCRLLTTIGKELDEAKAKTRVDQYFQQMSKIVSEKKTSSRIRFLLQDVVDLRLRNWVPRREDYNPKTIDQIHKDAAKEIAQKALLLSQPLPPSTPKHDGRRDNRDGRSTGRGGPPNRGSQNARNDDGWTPVSSKSLRNIDLTKMKITKTPVDDNIQLGPGGGSSRFGVWGRGSSGGGLTTKSSSQESESPANNAPANRFTALRPEDDGRPFGRGTSPARSDSRNRGMGGFGRGTLTPRSSQEMDRERAIANVRNIAGRGSNPASRENSRTRESRQDQKPDTKLLSEEEIEKKTKSIIEEYLHINDIKEACLCVSEINHPSNINQFVELSINSVLERSKIARQQTGNLHHELISKNIITVDAYLKGLKQALEIAEDMEIDIPKIWQYLGELIGPMIQDGCVPLNFLKQVCQPLQSSGKSGNLVAEILHDASQRLGHKKIALLWRNSELAWTDFVAEEDVKQFLIDKELEFTVANDSAPSTPVDKVSFETIQEQLLVRLRDENCDNEHIFDWIEANIPDEMTKCPRFIRTLMTAVCKSAIDEGVNCKVSDRVIKQRQALLVRYIDNQQEFELQALYALQVLVNDLQHPPGVLRSFFEYLYDEDVISETGFTQWSASDDPAEQEGKGVAMKAVVQFFAWLKEGENEES